MVISHKLKEFVLPILTNENLVNIFYTFLQAFRVSCQKNVFCRKVERHFLRCLILMIKTIRIKCIKNKLH